MLDIGFHSDDFAAAINDLVPPYQRAALIPLVNSNSISEMEATGRALVGESVPAGAIVPTGSGRRRKDADEKSVWSYIQDEVYDLFCTNSTKYKVERKDGAGIVEQIVSLLATAVAAHFSLPLGLVVGAVTVCLMIALKVGRNGYCEANKT